MSLAAYTILMYFLWLLAHYRLLGQMVAAINLPASQPRGGLDMAFRALRSLTGWMFWIAFGLAGIALLELHPTGRLQAHTWTPQTTTYVAIVVHLGLICLRDWLRPKNDELRPLDTAIGLARMLAVGSGIVAIALAMTPILDRSALGPIAAPVKGALAAVPAYAVALAALTVSLLLRGPALSWLRKRLLAGGGKRKLWLVGSLGLVEGMGTLTSLFALSAGAVAVALLGLDLWILQHGDTLSLDAALQAIAHIRHVQQTLGGIQLQLLVLIMAVLTASLAYMFVRGRRVQIGGLLQRERDAQFRVLTEKYQRNELEPLAPNEAMTRALNAYNENVRIINALAVDQKNGRKLSERERMAIGKADERRTHCARAYAFHDIDRRVKVDLDATQIRHAAARGRLGSLGTFFISRGMMGALSGVQRVVFVGTSLLLMPGCLIAVGAAPGPQARLATKLVEIEGLRIALASREATAVFARDADAAEATAKAVVASSQPTPRPRPDEEIDLASADWCTTKSPDCDRIVIARLSMAFDRGYAESLRARIGQTVIKGASPRETIRLAVLSEAKQRPIVSGRPFAQAAAISEAPDKAGARQVAIDYVASLDPFHDTSERKQFKEFLRTELVEKRPAMWGQLKGKLAVHAAAFRELPMRATLQEHLTLRAANVAFSTAGGSLVSSSSSPDAEWHMFGSSEGHGHRAPEINMQMFMSEMIATGVPDKAAARLRAIHNLDAGLRMADVGALQRVGPRIDVATSRAAAVMTERPATLSRLGEALSPERSSTVRDKLAALGISTRPSAPLHIGGYSELFASAGRGPMAYEAKRFASGHDTFIIPEAHAVPATPPAQPRAPFEGSPSHSDLFGKSPLPSEGGHGAKPGVTESHGRTGGRAGGRKGLILGTEPGRGPALDFRDLTWRREGQFLTLRFLRSDGIQIAVGPVREQTAHLALAFAADGRPVAATAPYFAPLHDQRVSLHPVLLDTSLGCRMLAVDYYVPDLIARNAELLKAVEAVGSLAQLYRLAWIMRADAVLAGIRQARAHGARGRLIDASIARLIADERVDLAADQEFERLLIQSNIDQVTALVSARPHHFDPAIVDAIRQCAAGPSPLTQVKACLSRSADGLVRQAVTGAAKQPATAPPKAPEPPRTEPANPAKRTPLDHWMQLPGVTSDRNDTAPTTPSGIAVPTLDAAIVLRALTPPPRLEPVPRVYEAAWWLDQDLKFARITARPPVGQVEALDFTVDLEFETPPYFKAGAEDWWDTAHKPKLLAPDEGRPAAVPGIDRLIHQEIKNLDADPVRRDERREVEEFVRLQRVFRAALSGQLGDRLPLDKLTVLTRGSRAAVMDAATPRWRANRGMVEIEFLRRLNRAGAAVSQSADKSRSRIDACFAVAGIDANELPDLGTPPPADLLQRLARISLQQWDAACLVKADELDGETLGWLAADSRKTAALRAVRAEAGIEADSRGVPDLGPRSAGHCAPL